MSSRDFYMFLPSNVDCPEFPDNKTNSYRTSLPTNLELEGWEVALSEIIYPHTWFNIDEDLCFLRCTKPIVDSDSLPVNTSLKIPIPSGYYTTPVNLINKINQLIIAARFRSGRSTLLFNSRFSYKPQKNVTRLTVEPNEKIEISPLLGAILGFKTNIFEARNEAVTIYDTIGVNLDLKINTIYVYSDIVTYSLVGNIYAPLLRAISTKKTIPGAYVTEEFTNRYYHSLIGHNISQIMISLNNDRGEPVDFQRGKVTVVLHFRKQE